MIPRGHIDDANIFLIKVDDSNGVDLTAIEAQHCRVCAQLHEQMMPRSHLASLAIVPPRYRCNQSGEGQTS